MSENTSGTVERDESMNLESLLSSTEPSATPESQEAPTQVETTKAEHKSPLDLAIDRQKTAQKGIIVDSANEQVGPVQLRPNTDTDAFREGFADELSELWNEGLITIKNDQVFLTNKGLDLANLVFEAFC